MTRFTKIATPISAIAIALSLSACGGGGGSSFKRPLDVSSEEIVITKDNYKSVAKSGLHDTQGQIDVLNDSDENAPIATSSTQTSVSRSAFKRYIQSLQDPSKSLSSDTALDQSISAQGSFSEKVDCELGGSVELKAYIASIPSDANLENLDLDSVSLNSGDNFQVRFNNCKEYDGFNNESVSLLQGSFKMEIGSRSNSDACTSNTAMECFELNLSANGFRESKDGTVVFAFDGGMRFSAEMENNEFDLAFDDLYFYSRDDDNYDGVYDAQTAISVDGETQFLNNELNISLHISSSESQSAMSIETPQALIYPNGIDGLPSDGTMVIYGANNAVLTIDIMDNGANVQLSLDEDGDGNVDESVIVTWQDLENEQGLFDETS